LARCLDGIGDIKNDRENAGGPRKNRASKARAPESFRAPGCRTLRDTGHGFERLAIARVLCWCRSSLTPMVRNPRRVM
jgi:hypothetical protein